MTDTFFAAKTGKEIADTVTAYSNKWSFTGGTGTFNALSMALWRNYIAWNNNLFTPESFDSALGSDGEVGEFIRCNINEARTVGRQYISLITRQKLYWDAITDVNSASPIQDTRLAKGIANCVTEKHRLQQKMYDATEKTYVYGASFLSAVWKTDKGYPYFVDENENIVYSGDIELRVHDVSDIVYDWSIEDWEHQTWVAVRSQYNKWDLAAQFPDLANQIILQPSARGEKRLIPRFNMLSSFDNPDMIYVWEFYLKPCPSLPKGRMVIYVNPNCVLFDGDNEYERIPIEPLMFSRVQGTGLGYPELSTLLPAQEIMDGVVSTIATNVRAFGKQNITMPKDSDIDPVQINDGLNVIRYDPIPNAPNGGVPTILDLCKVPPELFNFSNILNAKIGDLSGLSQAIRGNPPAGVTAGNALATLTANASEFLTQATAEYTLCVQNIMNHVINAYRRFATVEQTTNVVGESSIGYVKQWKAEDLKNVQYIKLRQTNSVMDSIAGRQQIADNLLQQGQINAGQYIKIQSGAPIESLFEDQLTEEMAVQQEVDAILEGKDIMPLITDNHPKFINAYQKLLYNPFVRANSQLTQEVLELMEARIQLEMQFQQNMQLYQMIRGQPSPATMMQPGEQANPQMPQSAQQVVAPTAKPAKPGATI